MSFNFGGNANGGNKQPFSFGNTSTPASNPPTTLFGNQNTTTPAGPPPTTTGFSFGQSAQTGSSNVFGNLGKQESTPSFGASTNNTVGQASKGFSFGSTPASTPSQGATATAASKPAFSFGNTSGANTSTASEAPKAALSLGANNATSNPVEKSGSPFSFGSTTKGDSAQASAGSKPSAQSSGGFSFGSAPTTNNNTVTKPATGGFSFGSTPTTDTSKDAPSSAAQSGTGGFSFGSGPSTNNDTAAKPATGGFSFGAAPATTSVKDTTPGVAQASAGGISFGAPASNATKATTSENKSDTTKPAGGFSFGGLTKAEEKKDTPTQPSSGGFSFGNSNPTEQKASQSATSTALTFGSNKAEEKKDANANTTAGAVSGPPPAPLKNKTMEDLINKWSTDLDKYSQDFQKQAKQISSWDQSLLASGDQISRLYAATVEAEQHSGKVDQALNYIENQQDELTQILDAYEAQVRDITAEVGVNQPADQEREKAYAKAEQLVGELDALGKNLGQMMDELNKSGEVMSRLNEDDPLTSIIKILNSQLQSLNWIDDHASRLNEKLDKLSSLKQAPPTQRSPGGNKFKFGSLRLE